MGEQFLGAGMRNPRFLDLQEARVVLASIGIRLNARQMKRAAEKDATGKRKLPFFVDPIDKKLKIEKGALLAVYSQCQADAMKNARLAKDELNK